MGLIFLSEVLVWVFHSRRHSVEERYAGHSPPHLTATQAIIAEKTVCILLVRGENQSGDKIFAYVAVRGDKLEDFMAAQTRGLFYPEEHGLVLASGPGEPSPEIRERMTREYGFKHEAMLSIPNAENARDVAKNLSHLKQFDNPE